MEDPNQTSLRSPFHPLLLGTWWCLGAWVAPINGTFSNASETQQPPGHQQEHAEADFKGHIYIAVQAEGFQMVIAICGSTLSCYSAQPFKRVHSEKVFLAGGKHFHLVRKKWKLFVNGAGWSGSSNNLSYRGCSEAFVTHDTLFTSARRLWVKSAVYWERRNKINAWMGSAHPDPNNAYVPLKVAGSQVNDFPNKYDCVHYSGEKCRAKMEALLLTWEVNLYYRMLLVEPPRQSEHRAAIQSFPHNH